MGLMGGSLDKVKEHTGRRGAHLQRRLAHRGQRRLGHRCGRDIVEANHGDVLGDRKTRIAQTPDRAHRHAVVESEDSSQLRLLRQQIGGGLVAALRREIAKRNQIGVIGQICLAECVAISIQPAGERSDGPGGADDADAPVAEADQVLGGGTGALSIVGVDRRSAAGG